MKKCVRVLLCMAPGLLFWPLAGSAQDGLAGDIHGLEATLNTVYDTMIVKCVELIGVGSGLAGFAALWYISVRVWGHLSRAEPIDFFPLLRPFFIGFCVINFGYVISLLNGIMQPTVAGTAALVDNSNKAVANLLQQKNDALKNSTDWQMYVGQSGNGSLDAWEKYSGDADNGTFDGPRNWVKFEMAKAGYNLKNSIKVWLSEILQVLFEAAALCINTVRTFYLVILAILGPLIFGLSVFDGLQHILKTWLARYINVFLWLPIANIFGSLIGQIQEEMIKLDIAQLQATGQTTFGATDAGFIIFLIMGIVGYFTVPSIANHIINAGGGLLIVNRMTSYANSTANTVMNTAGAGAQMAGGMISKGAQSIGKGMNETFGTKEGYSAQSGGNSGGSYLAEKIKGDG